MHQRIYNEFEKIAEDEIDISDKLRNRGVTVTNPFVPYVSDNNLTPNSLAVSGGQILPMQNITKTDYSTGEIISYNEEISINIKARYDLNDSSEKRWNIDVYVHINNPNMKLKEKRLIKHHSDKLHHLPDCKQLKILSWIDGIEQPPIIAKRPQT
jgi:hypothetical protein